MSAAESISRTIEGWTFDAGDHVASLCWLPGGQRLAVAPAAGHIAVVDRATGSLQLSLPGHAGGNRFVAASRAHPLLATGGNDGVLRLWNTDSGERVREVECAGQGWIEQLAWSPNGMLLAATAARTLRVWNASGELVFAWDGHDSTITALAWRPDSCGIATGCYNGVRLFRFPDTNPYERLAWKGSIISLAWSPNARFVAGGSQENTIQFWRLPNRAGDELFMSGYQTKVKELAWDKDSRFLATGGGETITIWDVSGRGPRGRIPLLLQGHTAKLTQLAFQHRGPLLASGGADGVVFIWDFKAGKRHRRQLARPAAISVLAWSGDDSVIAIGGADGTVCIWESFN